MTKINLDPSKIFFTSDNHFMHKNICDYSSRPFSSEEEMKECMIEAWNSKVKRDCLVFHNGDFAISWGKGSSMKIDAILERLNGTKFLIAGNHDRKEVKLNERWAKVMDMHEIKVDLGGVHRQRIVLCHYPLRTWNQMHRGAWMLHGHCHGNLPDKGGKIMDVGVDCVIDYAPISLLEVADFMSHRELALSGDHHK